MRMRPLLAVLLLGLAPAAGSADGPLDEVAAVRSFMHEAESRHGLDGAWLREIFRDARRRQSVLDAFGRPAEAKPWHAYREIFVTPARIRGGAAFAREHQPVLERVRGPASGYRRRSWPRSSGSRPSTGGTRAATALSTPSRTLAFFSPPPECVLPPRARGVSPVPQGGEPAHRRPDGLLCRGDRDPSVHSEQLPRLRGRLRRRRTPRSRGQRGRRRGQPSVRTSVGTAGGRGSRSRSR